MVSSIHPVVVPAPAITCAYNYKDSLIHSLPTIIAQRTLAAKLCGQEDNEAFNGRVITLTHRLYAHAHVAFALVCITGLPLFFLEDTLTRQILTGLHVLPGLFCFVYMCASLSWDMMLLVMQTFEFWFLSAMNAINTLSWSLLFHDTRVIAIISIGMLYGAALCVDAASWTRHFVARAFLLASPSLFVNIALAAARFTPDLHYRTFTTLGVEVDSIDVLVNGNLVIAYFTGLRVLRLRHLVLSSDPIQRVECGMWYPYSQLVPLPSEAPGVSPAKQEGQLTQNEPLVQQLKVEDSFATETIDVNNVVWLRLARLVQRHLRPQALTGIGFASHLTAIIGGCWSLSDLPADRSGRSQASNAVSIIGLACAFAYAITYLASCQRQLLKRIFLQLDAWFVLFQMTVVTVGFCDLVAWDVQLVLPLLTAWIWCHWTVCLDAVPPVTRSRLAYSRTFTRLSCFVLVVYPVALAYALCISADAFRQRDRVLVKLDVGGVQWQIRLRGFLASKLFTLQVWMVRFLWREIVRPADAFKLIKWRVYYEVGTFNNVASSRGVQTETSVLSQASNTQEVSGSRLESSLT